MSFSTLERRDSISGRQETDIEHEHGQLAAGAWYGMDDNIKVLTFIYVFLMMSWLFILLIRCWDILFNPERRTE